MGRSGPSDRRRSGRAADASAVVPEVAFLDHKPVSPETEQRHPCQILAAAIRQSGLRTPGNGSLITVDKRRRKPALRRFLLREHTGQIARLRIAEWMLLPERAFGVKRADSGNVMCGPAALPYLRPPLGCLSRIHTPTLDKTTGKRPCQQRWRATLMPPTGLTQASRLSGLACLELAGGKTGDENAPPCPQGEPTWHQCSCSYLNESCS